MLTLWTLRVWLAILCWIVPMHIQVFEEAVVLVWQGCT